MWRIYGATISILVGFGSAIALAYLQAYTAAGIAVGGTLLGIVGCFIGNDGTKKKKPPESEK